MGFSRDQCNNLQAARNFDCPKRHLGCGLFFRRSLGGRWLLCDCRTMLTRGSSSHFPVVRLLHPLDHRSVRPLRRRTKTVTAAITLLFGFMILRPTVWALPKARFEDGFAAADELDDHEGDEK